MWKYCEKFIWNVFFISQKDKYFKTRILKGEKTFPLSLLFSRKNQLFAVTLDSLESFVWKIYWKDLINSTASIQLRLSFIHKNVLNFPYSICTTVTCISVNFSSLRIKFIFQKYSENEPINLGIFSFNDIS